MKNKNKSFLGFFCFLTLSLTACEAKEPAASSPYPVYDSGAWADPFGSADIYWLDNNRVIFRSVQDNDKRRVTVGPFNLSIWEIGKGVKPYTEYYPSVTVCVRDDMIHRTQKDASGNVQRFYGKFGEEKPFEFPKTKGTFFDELNCHPNENPEILAKRAAGRAIIPLLDRHGYLDRGAVSGEESLRPVSTIFYRPGHSEYLKLPVRIGHVNYYAFKDAYLFQADFSPDAPATFKSRWPSGILPGGVKGWLYPEGRIEPLIIPAEPWPDKKVPKFGSGSLNPLRNGFLVRTGKAKGPKDAGTLGGYLLSNKKLVKVVGGYLSELTVSPDGCKVAFVHYPYSDATFVQDLAPIRLKAIDLCSTKEENRHGQ